MKRRTVIPRADKQGEGLPLEERDDEKPTTQSEPSEDSDVELRRQLEEAQTQAESHLDQWRRTLAEFSNYKKRSERENTEFQKLATANLVQRLLPVLDDFDRAFANLPEPLTNDGWVGGIEMVRQKLVAVLTHEGVQPIDEGDGVFNPDVHEALTYEGSAEHEDGQIIQVIRKGYLMGDRVLRPAQVRVARKVQAD